MFSLNFYFGLALIIAQLASCWAPPAPAVHKRGGAQHEAKDKRGAVASESSVCSNTGINLIKDGGNAADAVSGKPSCARRYLGLTNLDRSDYCSW